MKKNNETAVKQLCDQYNSVMENLRMEIDTLTDGGKVDFDENGFEDVSHNDITGIDGEDVLLADGETCSYHELDFWDGIKIIEAIQKAKEDQDIEDYKTMKRCQD